MPPKKQQDVYVVVGQEGGDGVSAAPQAYSTMEAAKDATREMLEETMKEDDAIDENEADADMCHFKLTSGGATTSDIKIWKVQVQDAPAKGKRKAAPEKTVAARPKAKGKASKTPAAAPEDDEAEDDEAEEEKPAPKKPAAKASKAVEKNARKEIPEGTPNALAGLKLLFTGTMDLDRATMKKTAEKYGASVITKLEDTDYVVLGTKAGANKLKVIEENELETIDEDEFLLMLQTGVSDDKRARMKARRAADEMEAPPKKKAKK